MKDQIIMLLIGILIALGGWNLTQTFSLSTTQAVIDDKVDKLERAVEKIQDQIDNMQDKDEEFKKAVTQITEKTTKTGVLKELMEEYK